MAKLTLIQGFIEGMKIIADMYPDADSGAEHDEFYIYHESMVDDDGNRLIPKDIVSSLESLGFYWSDMEGYFIYNT